MHFGQLAQGLKKAKCFEYAERHSDDKYSKHQKTKFLNTEEETTHFVNAD